MRRYVFYNLLLFSVTLATVVKLWQRVAQNSSRLLRAGGVIVCVLEEEKLLDHTNACGQSSIITAVYRWGNYYRDLFDQADWAVTLGVGPGMNSFGLGLDEEK